MTSPVTHPTEHMPSAAIELDGVYRTYTGAAEPVHALRPCTLRVPRGDYVAVTGPSGSGKSTLLNVLGLLDEASGGSYLLDGDEVVGMTEARRTVLRGRHLGFVFQAFHLLPYRTAAENVELAMLYAAVPARRRRERARDVLRRVGLDHRLDAYPPTLSGGERQRVAIARAVVHEPKVLLCDEPTGQLDVANSRSVLDLLARLNEAGLTILVVTHDSAVAARADHRVTITDGHLTEEAT
ncbi:MAG: ABC transporter ATP-binding protein [Spirillospora sp.]